MLRERPIANHLGTGSSLQKTIIHVQKVHKNKCPAHFPDPMGHFEVRLVSRDVLETSLTPQCCSYIVPGDSGDSETSLKRL